MRVEGTLQAPYTPPLRRRKKPLKVAPDSRSPEVEIIRLADETDYLGADAQPDWEEAELSYLTRKALRGYWNVAHQARLWVEFQRVDVYV